MHNEQGMTNYIPVFISIWFRYNEQC